MDVRFLGSVSMFSYKGGVKVPTFYSPLEVANYLRVDRRTVYNWLRSGKLTAVKAAKIWRIPQRSLDEFLRDNVQAVPVPPVEVMLPPGVRQGMALSGRTKQRTIYDVPGVDPEPEKKPEPVLRPMKQQPGKRKNRRR